MMTGGAGVGGTGKIACHVISTNCHGNDSCLCCFSVTVMYLVAHCNCYVFASSYLLIQARYVMRQAWPEGAVFSNPPPDPLFAWHSLNAGCTSSNCTEEAKAPIDKTTFDKPLSSTQHSSIAVHCCLLQEGNFRRYCQFVRETSGV